MAVKKVIELEVDVDALQKSVTDIQKDFKELKESVQSFDKTGKKTNKDLQKGFKGVNNQVVSLQKGFSGLALAIKSIGIGLVLEAFNTFKQVLAQNQTVTDTFAIAFGALSKIFNDFINFAIDNSGKVVEFFQNIFENPLESVKALGAAIKANIIERAQSAVDVLGFLADAAVKFFNRDFKGALDSVKDAGKELVDVYTGVDDTFDKQVEVITKVGKGLKKLGQEAIDAAAAEVKLANAAELAAAEQEKLRVVNLTAAEDQRKIRDNISLTIEDRIAANEQLGVILLKGIEDEKQLAKIQRQAAEAALANSPKLITLKADLIRAQTAELEITERIGGIQAEQETNRVALLKEQLDLKNSNLEAESALRLQAIQAELDIEDGILNRLDLEQKVADEEVAIANAKFAEIEKLFGKNTVEYKAALIEQTAAVKNASDTETKITKLKEEAKRQIVADALGGLSQLLGQESAAGKAVAIAQSIINTYQGATKALGQGGIFGAVAAAGVIASGMASVKKIVATKIPGAEGGGGSAAIAGVSAQVENLEQNVPDFNVVGDSPINQIAQSLNRQPVKAFVVSGDVTTAQQLDRNIINESGI